MYSTYLTCQVCSKKTHLSPYRCGGPALVRVTAVCGGWAHPHTLLPAQDYFLLLVSQLKPNDLHVHVNAYI